MSTVATAAVDRREVVSLFARLRTGKGQADPLPTYERLMSMGEVIPVPWGGYLVTSYHLCHQVLRDKFWKVPDRGWRTGQADAARWSSPASLQMSDSLPMLNPPDHTRRRRSLGNVFHQDSLVALRPSIETTVERLLDRFTDRLRHDPADFVDLVSEELPVITIGEWMGIPSADYGLLRSLTHDQAHTQELFPTPTQLALSNTATRRLRHYFTDLIEERRNAPGDDPVSSWLKTWDRLEPTRSVADEAVLSLAIFMILAALETTSYVLSGAVRLLLEHPQQMELLRGNPELIPDAIEETLRYDAPIHMISRVASEDTEVGGMPVPAGGMLMLMVGAAHHDPARYADPQVFDVRRRARAQEHRHLSFGTGIHYCLGSALARLEAEVLLTSLLRRPDRFRLSAPPQWAARVAFRRLTSLQLALA
ncbi:cytochrome P450 [Streptomyces sp. NPDC001843]|uniref:cytochrome P450 n=1 Tax=Streptomyces sp. NPDC001843 TaxID=3364617 RepID=UPI0036CD40A0